MKRGRKPKQQTLESTLGQQAKPRGPGRPKTKLPAKAQSSPIQSRLTSGSGPSPNFMTKGRLRGPFISNDTSDESGEPQPSARRPSPKTAPSKADRPLASSQPSRKRVISDNSDDPVLDSPVPSSARRRKRAIVLADDEDEDSEEEIVSATKRRRLVRKGPASPLSDDDDFPLIETVVGGAKVSTPKKAAGKDTPVKRGSRSARKAPRSEKQKQMELLRRRRRGEKIDSDDLTESSEEERGALYDTDSDNVALSQFEDDDDDEEQEQQEEPSSPLRRSTKEKMKKAKSTPTKASEYHGDDPDLVDFVVEDDDSLIGVPADLLRSDIPLEFTAHAHKPLKAHFKDALEWLVQRRINPAFDKNDAVYKLAWRKLGDEVGGLASSKFMSSGWKPEFLKALRARPYMDSFALDKGDPDRLRTCHACGRSNHPATFTINFDGAAYHKDTLDDVESESEEDDEDDEDDDGDDKSIDEDGNTIEPRSKQWFVGVVCNSNAETAHSLIHWKRALMDWVEERLKEDGYLTAEKLQERDKMKPKKRRELANEAVDKWEMDGIVKALWGDFNTNLERARNQSTTGRGRARAF